MSRVNFVKNRIESIAGINIRSLWIPHLRFTFGVYFLLFHLFYAPNWLMLHHVNTEDPFVYIYKFAQFISFTFLWYRHVSYFSSYFQLKVSCKFVFVINFFCSAAAAIAAVFFFLEIFVSVSILEYTFHISPNQDLINEIANLRFVRCVLIEKWENSSRCDILLRCAI